MWRNNDCPCTRDCPDRWVKTDGPKPATCHGSCPKYEAWVAKRNAEKKEATIRSEGRCVTNATRKAYWKSYRRNSTGVYKKFSQ